MSKQHVYPKIAYARELQDNKFAILLNMVDAKTNKPYYIGGIAVLGDLQENQPIMPPTLLSLNLRINFLEYKEVDPNKFILEDQRKFIQAYKPLK